MRISRFGFSISPALAAILISFFSQNIRAQVPSPDAAAPEIDLVFSTEEWDRIEGAVDRGLSWLSKQQSANGQFPSPNVKAQPAVTALAAMAFLSRGHQPGQGPYGELLRRAINYVISTQDRFGLFVSDYSYQYHGTTYCHAISGVMLAEALGLAGQKQNEQIAEALQRGLDATIKLQARHWNSPVERGGWRYLVRRNPDADLSVTTWHLLFLRAAKNAGYPVPEKLVIDAAGFVRRCYSPGTGEFGYLPGRRGTITMTGAGTLCLFLAGRPEDEAFKRGAQTLASYDFRKLNSVGWRFYTCYHSSQAAAQAGGHVKKTVLRGVADYLLREQSSAGSWPAEGSSRNVGENYTTAMAILSLTPAYQILPIYQQ